MLVTQEQGVGGRAGDQELRPAVAGLLALSPTPVLLGVRAVPLLPYQNEVTNTMFSRLLGHEGGQIL